MLSSQDMHSQDMFANDEDDNYDLHDENQIDLSTLPGITSRRYNNYLREADTAVPIMLSYVDDHDHNVAKLLLSESNMELSPSIFRGLSDSENGSMSQLISNDDLLHAVQLQPLAVDVDIRQSNVQQPGPSSAISRNQLVFIDNNDSLVKNICSEMENISLKEWKGDFNFRVVPAPPPEVNNKKRCIYSPEINKLYTKDSIAVPFKIEMDYANMKNPSSYLIRACLVFENPDDIDKPVLRCPSHIDSEKNLTEPSQLDRLHHLIRPGQPHSDTKYIQNRVSRRCFLLMPVVVPEPGTDSHERSFIFTCLSSCKGNDAISRKPVSLLFTLYDSDGRLMGRSPTCVRICSAPLRDSNKDKGRISGEGSSRRKRSGEDLTEDNDQTAPKRANLERVATSVRCTVAAAAGSADDDAMSSSQETIYSLAETGHRIRMRQLVGDIRWALKLKTSRHPALQDYAKQIYSSLRLTHDMCASARRLEETLNSFPEDPEETPRVGIEPSPDAGFAEIN